MKVFKKVTAIFLVLVSVLSLVSCNKPKAQKKLPEFGDWYDTERAYFPISSMSALYGFDTVAVTDDYVITRRNYYEFISGEEVNYDSLFKLSFSGDYSEFSLKDLLENINVSGQKRIESVIEFNSEIYAIVSRLNPITYTYNYYMLKINIDDQSYEDLIELECINDEMKINTGPLINVIKNADELIFQFSGSDVATIIKMRSDFTCEKIDILEYLESFFLVSVSDCFMVDSNKMMLVGDPVSGSSKFFVIDLSTDSIECIEDTTAFRNVFSNRELNYSYAGNGYFNKDSYGLYQYNFELNDFEKVFSFDDCNANRWELQQRFLSLIYVDENTYVFGGSVQKEGGYSYNYELIRLEKSEVDLRDGKEILTAVNLDVGITPVIAEAVYRFNENNPEYYLVLFDDFSVLNYGYMYLGEGEAIESFETQTEGRNQLSTDIALSLLSGGAPDIFLNSAVYSMINNSNCLMDLTPFITGENGVNTDEYFSSIFADSLNGNPVYQLPVVINVNGTFGKFIPTNEYGLSFEDYVEQIQTVAHGYDYIAEIMIRMETFDYLLNSITDEIIVDNRITLDNENFNAIVEYCSNLPEIPLRVVYANAEEIPEMPMPNFSMTCHDNITFSSFTDRGLLHGRNPVVLTGFPSGSANIEPTIRIKSSAAISADCEHPDGAWEFLKELISYESQCKAGIADLSFAYGDPINVEAFERTVAITINSRNQSNQIIAEDLLMPIDEVSMELLYEYEDILDRACINYDLDPAIVAIMNEEIQAYFAGDKTLEEVKAIIEDRVQTLLDERG